MALPELTRAFVPMVKCSIGHFVEAYILQALEVGYVDESEVVTHADVEHHVDKWLRGAFVCGVTNVELVRCGSPKARAFPVVTGEALQRLGEGSG